MTVQLSTQVRNARLDAIETAIGASPKLRIYGTADGSTLTLPANTVAAITGILLIEITLPADFLQAASGGSKQINGTWSALVTAAGKAQYYRIWDNAGTTCHEQGSVGQGTGDLALDNVTLAVGQTVQITAFTKTDANA